MAEDDSLSFLIVSILLIIVLMILGTIFFAIDAEFKSRIYNKIHGTNYNFIDFMFGKEIILDYTEGKQININLQEENQNG